MERNFNEVEGVYHDGGTEKTIFTPLTIRMEVKGVGSSFPEAQRRADERMERLIALFRKLSEDMEGKENVKFDS